MWCCCMALCTAGVYPKPYSSGAAYLLGKQAGSACTWLRLRDMQQQQVSGGPLVQEFTRIIESLRKTAHSAADRRARRCRPCPAG